VRLRCCVAAIRVICVDNFETGLPRQHRAHPRAGVRHLHTDIIEPFFVDEPVDFVYHFASPASPIDYLRCRCTR
jgi:dTDP-glucose 4,6-dehydratase